jgi:hypothetical protein
MRSIRFSQGYTREMMGKVGLLGNVSRVYRGRAVYKRGGV